MPSVVIRHGPTAAGQRVLTIRPARTGASNGQVNRTAMELGQRSRMQRCRTLLHRKPDSRDPLSQAVFNAVVAAIRPLLAVESGSGTAAVGRARSASTVERRRYEFNEGVPDRYEIMPFPQSPDPGFPLICDHRYGRAAISEPPRRRTAGGVRPATARQNQPVVVGARSALRPPGWSR
jgi:hypothetical protein